MPILLLTLAGTVDLPVCFSVVSWSGPVLADSAVSDVRAGWLSRQVVLWVGGCVGGWGVVAGCDAPFAGGGVVEGSGVEGAGGGRVEFGGFSPAE